MKKIITYVMIFTMLITTAAVSMAVPASAAVKKQSKRQVTLIRSYNKIYRKCKKNFKYDGSQLEMNQDSYKEFAAFSTPRRLRGEKTALAACVPGKKVQFQRLPRGFS